MANFTITRVSSKPPRTWAFTDKKTGERVQMETYNVMVEGESEAVEVNRKPGDAPTTGEVLVGTLDKTEFGLRFKKESKSYTPGQKSYVPKDEAAIKAMWAIGQAITFLGFTPDTSNVTDVEPLARDMFLMVDRVKLGTPSGYEKAATVAKQIKEKAVDDGFGKTEEIDLDEIPF